MLPELLDRNPVRRKLVPESTQPGIVTGLAWTPAGGDILYIQTLLTKGSGKITVTGQLGDVNPIGGLPEKLMAAQRAGVKKVFIPKDNIEDLKDVADEVRNALEIRPVSAVSEVFEALGLPVESALQMAG